MLKSHVQSLASDVSNPIEVNSHICPFLFAASASTHNIQHKIANVTSTTRLNLLYIDQISNAFSIPLHFASINSTQLYRRQNQSVVN